MDYIQFIAFLFFSCISFFCTIYFSNEKIREGRKGENFIKSTEWILTKTLFNRAESTIHTDLKSASRFFGKLTLGLIALAFITDELKLSIRSYFFLVGGICLFFGFALSWGKDPYKETIGYLKQFLFFAMGTVGLCLFMPEIPPINIISNEIYSLEVVDSPIALKIIVCALLISVLLVAYTLSYIIWGLFNSIFVGCFLLLSRLTARISRKVIDNQKEFSLYIHIIGFVSTLLSGSLFEKEWLLKIVG